MSRTAFVGKCVECGASLYYNSNEEKLVVKGKPAPGCLCHFDWPEDREGEEEDQNDNVKMG